ncbi:MAG: GSU2403 family nucleotidyltransferase fold protein [Burkholderiales bacterium]
MATSRFSELSLGAQTAYAEIFERARAFELDNALAGLPGGFHVLERKGRKYWYFSYREPGGERTRVVYIGPDNAQVGALVDRFKSNRQPKGLAPQASAAISLGCATLASKHFRILKRLAEYGLFRAGGVLVGTHAFLSLGNLLGVRWNDGATTLDVDLTHAGRNVSVALPADLRIDTHAALESLEMGLLPITELDGQIGAQYRNPADEELRVDFLTSRTRSGKPVKMPELNIVLEPLKFMEFSLEGTTQGCLIARGGACTVNLPAPERYAVHKLIVYGERPLRERTKATKDLFQAAALASYFAATDRPAVFNIAWRDAWDRGRGWRARAREGRQALLRIAPELDIPALRSTR